MTRALCLAGCGRPAASHVCGICARVLATAGDHDAGCPCAARRRVTAVDTALRGTGLVAFDIVTVRAARRSLITSAAVA